MLEPISNEGAQVALNLLRLHRVMDVWIERTVGMGTVNELRALLYVYERPGATVREIQNRLSMSGPGTTQMVAILTRKGRGGQPPLEFLRAERDATDGRVRHMYLTKKGRAVIERFIEELGHQ